VRVFITLLLLLLAAVSAIAAETRGLTVVAKDKATSRTGEVKLYNKSYAVIIGIDRYQNLPPDRQLQNAVKDAKGVEAALKKNFCFDRIITLLNEEATRERILELLTEELPAEMGKEDSLFLFWAGHGNQEKSDYGDMGYLIPFDGSVDKIRKNITMAEIRDTVSKKLPAKHIFYVMDACYSGLLTTRSVDSKSRRDLAYLKEITKENVRQVLTAGGKNEEALDGGPKGHSVFTGRLIEILENAQDFITANELQARIKEKVFSDARARNHTQTPGFGPLYGLGDYVFVPIQLDKLGNLAGESLTRQKELELLKKAEAEADAAKQKEQAEIFSKQAELDVLDKEIAEMKVRLGSGAARSSDSLDAILDMAEQKAEQAKRLEELRQQRYTEERKRQAEIERLKREAIEKRIAQIITDFGKYQKIAANQYAQDMKITAWDALITTYPEARDVSRYDLYAFLASQGLAFDNGKIVTVQVKQQREQLQQRAAEELKRALAAAVAAERDRLIYTDPKTGLMWARNGNIAGKEMSWDTAMVWAKNLSYSGYSDWRLPTKEELESFAKRGGKNPLEWFNANGFNSVQAYYYWSSSTFAYYSNYAWDVDMSYGYVYNNYKSNGYYVWPIRAGQF
jgi:hypothetical protein